MTHPSEATQLPAVISEAHLDRSQAVTPLLANYPTLLPFPNHWDGELQMITQRLFSEGRFDEAIRSVTMRLEARLRELSGAQAEMIGLDLVSFAFKPNGGFLEPKALPLSEREGLHQLFRGAIQQVRNPVSHRNLSSLPGQTFDTIAFVNYLLDTAQQVAMLKYVWPFVGQWIRPNLLLSIQRADINADGCEELIVIIRYDDLTGPNIQVIVLSSDGASSLRGKLHPISGTIIGATIIDDLDGDAKNEILLNVGIQVADKSFVWRGLVFDVVKDNVVSEFGTSDPKLLSSGMQLEIIRPMEAAVPVIVGKANAGQPTWWTFDEKGIHSVATAGIEPST